MDIIDEIPDVERPKFLDPVAEDTTLELQSHVRRLLRLDQLPKNQLLLELFVFAEDCKRDL